MPRLKFFLFVLFVAIGGVALSYSTSRIPAQANTADYGDELSPSYTQLESPFLSGINNIKNSLEKSRSEITSFKTRLTDVINYSSGDVQEYNQEFSNLEERYFVLLKGIEQVFSHFDDKNFVDVLDSEIDGVVRLYRLYSSSFLDLAMAKAMMVSLGQGDGFQEWIKRFTLTVPSKVFEYFFGGGVSLNNYTWQKSYTIFLSSPAKAPFNPGAKASVDSQYVSIRLNPHFFSAAVRGFNISSNFGEEGLFSIAQYIAMDRLQQSWRSLQVYRGDEKIESLVYPSELLAKYKDLSLEQNMFDEDTAYNNRGLDMKFIKDTYRDSKLLLPDFYDDQYFEDLKEILYINDDDASVQHVISEAFVNGVKSISPDMRDAQFSYLLSDNSIDVELATPEQLERTIHLLLVRSYIAADMLAFNGQLKDLIAKGRYIQQEIESISADKKVKFQRRVILQGAKFLEALERSKVFSISKQKFFENREEMRNQQILDYQRGVMAHVRMLTGKQDPGISVNMLAQALYPKIQALKPSAVVVQYASFFGMISEYNSGLHYYARVLKSMQDDLANFVAIHSVASRKDISKDKAKSKGGIKDFKPVEKSVERGFWQFVFMKQGLRDYLTPQERVRLRYSSLSEKEFDSILQMQLEDLEAWMLIGEMMGFRGEQVRFSNAVEAILPITELGVYNKLMEKELLSSYPFLGIQLKGSDKKLYKELEVIGRESSDTHPKIAEKIAEAFTQVEEGLLKAWAQTTEAKTFEDLEYVLLNNPMIHARIEHSFPEFKSVLKIVQNKMKLPSAYEKHFGAQMHSANSIFIMPLFIMQIARWAIASRLPGLSAAMTPLIEAWRVAIPGMFWALWGTDFVAGQVGVIADTGLGFRMGWSENGPEILPSRLMEETDLFFYSSVEGTPIIETNYYEGVRAHHISAVKGVYFHLAFDAYIFGTIASGLGAQLNASRAQQGVAK